MSFDGRPDPDRVFLDALSDGHLIVQSCSICGVHRAPPAECCPECGASGHTWRRSAGTGRLERSILLGEADSFGDDPEITRAIGAVRLSEGPTVSVRLVGPVPPVGAEMEVQVLSGSLIAQSASTSP
ncbi:MAG: zinc ribbon domain-containing protein [Dinoroseobacter sp.]|nr:zinc ribbon domain-containing protein [Dinoroseobacter sp.]MDJ0994519.1 zinc ribbon domain-containing protein [Dinoroseobacter sp.]